MSGTFIDTHAHVQLMDYEADRGAVLQRAFERGVKVLVIVGTDLESSRASVTLSKSFNTLYSAVGIHPHEASSIQNIDWASLSDLASSEKVVAIGEIGLDYYKGYSSAADQQELFHRQLLLAKECRKPCILHVRNAFDDVLHILKEVFLEGVGGIAHCFSGTVDEAKVLMELGFYISFAANITYPKADPLREVIKHIPLDRLVLETDCPFLPPQSKRGQRNEPAYIVETYLHAAQLLEIPVEALAGQVYQNACSVLALPLANQ